MFDDDEIVSHSISKIDRSKFLIPTRHVITTCKTVKTFVQVESASL